MRVFFFFICLVNCELKFVWKLLMIVGCILMVWIVLVVMMVLLFCMLIWLIFLCFCWLIGCVMWLCKSVMLNNIMIFVRVIMFRVGWIRVIVIRKIGVYGVFVNVRVLFLDKNEWMFVVLVRVVLNWWLFNVFFWIIWLKIVGVSCWLVNVFICVRIWWWLYLSFLYIFKVIKVMMVK